MRKEKTMVEDNLKLAKQISHTWWDSAGGNISILQHSIAQAISEAEQRGTERQRQADAQICQDYADETCNSFEPLDIKKRILEQPRQEKS
jgi:hypothetical protein